MKTIRNKKTGDIQRVDNKTADNMVGISWEFIPKSEWKKGREVPTEKQKADVSKKEITQSKKQQSRQKLKEKQRSL
jgi:hypothetical protein